MAFTPKKKLMNQIKLTKHLNELGDLNDFWTGKVISCPGPKNNVCISASDDLSLSDNFNASLSDQDDVSFNNDFLESFPADDNIPEFAAPAIECATPLVAENKYKLNENTFLADSAASSHMGGCEDGMFDTREEQCSVRIGDGKLMTSTKIGKKRVTVVQANGTQTEVVLDNYKFVPGLWVNLFALLIPLAQGWLISNKGSLLTIKKGTTSISFDRIFKTKDGLLAGVDMIPRGESANLTLQTTKPQDINYMHRILGHSYSDTLRNTAKYYDIPLKVRTPMEPCEMCKIANASQVDVPKETSTHATKPGERFFIDITGVKDTGIGGYKIGVGILDDYSDCMFGALLKHKNDQQQVILAFLQKLQARGVNTAKITIFIRLDNSGENKALQAFLTANGFGHVQFEFTPRESPQYAGRVERKFATLWSRVRSLLNAAKLPLALRSALWPKAFLLAILIENIIVPLRKDMTSYKLFHGKDYGGISHLHQFGEVAIVKTGKKIQSKLDNKGSPLIYCGPAKDHSYDTHTFLNPKTKKFIESRDVNLWMHQVYGEYKGLSAPSQPSTVITLPIDKTDDPLPDDTPPPIENAPAPAPVPIVTQDEEVPAPPVLQSPTAPQQKRMVRELAPHLIDPQEETTFTQDIENVRVTRSQARTQDLDDQATFAQLAMCDKYQNFDEFAMVASQKYDWTAGSHAH